MSESEADIAIRKQAFQWLDAQAAIYDDAMPRKILQQGFRFQSERVRLLGPQGIFKPRCMKLPISITTVPDGPYADSIDHDGFLRYRYRGTDPMHRDNVGLRRAKEIAAPLVYFHRIVPGKYAGAWPVFIVQDDPARLTFRVAVDDVNVGSLIEFDTLRDPNRPQIEAHFRRAYATRNFRQRLHQSAFRERVLRAYRDQCALCRLRHRELLDAAHIIPDAEPGGAPEVANGPTLCKIHNAAIDRFFVAVKEDYTVEVRADILEETDGPMLLHGLQKLHGTKIIMPRSAELRPRREFLQWRYERFRMAG